MRQFYTNVLAEPDYLAAMANFAQTQERLEAGLAKVAAAEAAYAERLREEGEAQEATRLRDEKVEAFDDWMDQFEAVARIAFKNQPQQLEKLGLIVPS